MRSLEEFVCLLYGSRRVKKFNDLRHQLFQKTYQQKNKIIDLSLLPPCQQTLRLHSLRCNFVVKIRENSDVCTSQEPPITNHGWTGEREIQWIEKAFPDDIVQLLSEGSDDTYFEETDSDLYSYLSFAILKSLKPSSQNFSTLKTSLRHTFHVIPVFTVWDVTMATKLQKILQDICL